MTNYIFVIINLLCIKKTRKGECPEEKNAIKNKIICGVRRFSGE